jgi:hypothetical protein
VSKSLAAALARGRGRELWPNLTARLHGDLRFAQALPPARSYAGTPDFADSSRTTAALLPPEWHFHSKAAPANCGKKTVNDD